MNNLIQYVLVVLIVAIWLLLGATASGQSNDYCELQLSVRFDINAAAIGEASGWLAGDDPGACSIEVFCFGDARPMEPLLETMWRAALSQQDTWQCDIPLSDDDIWATEEALFAGSVAATDEYWATEDAEATSGPPALATHTPLSLPIRSTPVQFVPPTAIPAQTIAVPTIAQPSPVATDIIPTATVGGAPDADFDGIADAADECPADYGYADNQGCPYSDDEDRDGIRDSLDACPQEFAPDTARGCRDFDDDGLDTAADECPNEAGPAANQGCPLSGVAGG